MSPVKVVVTGASGHLGFHVARECLARGYETRILARSLNVNVAELQYLGAQLTLCDLLSPATYRPAFVGAHCLFHVAAENTTSVRHRDRTLRHTVNLAEVVLTAALEAGVPVLIVTSSVVALGRSDRPERIIDENSPPETGRGAAGFESPYVEGKTLTEELCERLIRERGADVRRLYPSWLVGPGDLKGTPPHRVVADYVARGQRVWFDGGISVASVLEAAKAHVRDFDLGRPGDRYILAGENVTFQQFFTLLAEVTGRKPPAVKLARSVVLAASRVGTALFKCFGREFPVTPGYARAVLGRYSWYSSARAERELGYRVIPARELLAEAVLETRRRNAGVLTLGRRRPSARSRVAASPPNPAREPDSTTGPVATSEAEIATPLLITGVPGWLGNRMVDILINGDRFGRFASKRPVRLLVEPGFKGLLRLPENFEIVHGDICDPEAVGRAVAGVGTVFHLAGAIYPPRIGTLYRVNVEGTRNLAECCLRQGVRRILYMGTDSICGRGSPPARVFDERTPARPYRHYGQSKFQAEELLLRLTAEGRLEATSLRGFWFFGPFAPARQLRFANMFRWRRQVVFGNGRNLRSISHIDDIIAAFFLAERQPATIGKWYWICDERPYLVAEIYSALAAAAGGRYRPFHVPVLLCRGLNIADRVLGWAGRLHPTIHAAGKFYFDIAGDIAAARRDFGFEPRLHLTDAARELFEPNV